MKKLIAMILVISCSLSLCACNKIERNFSMWKTDGVITELVSYVDDITDKKSDNFIPIEDRIAVFDLDGTLICEQFPIYVEWLLFVHRVLNDSSFKADEELKEVANAVVLACESRKIPEDIEEKESQLFGKAFEGMTIEEYRTYVENFLSKQADGFDNLCFKDAYFRPMIEVIKYLEKNDFKIYICSGTDREADRIIAHGFSDIPNYQIIGSDYYTEGSDHDDVYYIDYQFGPDEDIMRDDTRIIKNVKSSKVVQISQEIGQKPVLAFGNSTGDVSMFVYTTYNNQYKSAAFCIVPDDNEREYACPEKVENLKEICDENSWHTISMKEDFLNIYGDTVIKNESNTAFVDSLKNN